MPSFVILYIGSNDSTTVLPDGSTKAAWKVDTGEQGEVASYDDLETALSRVKDIRAKGGDACLATIIE